MINGNTAQLKFFGKARGIPVEASGTLKVSGNQGGVDGTYNIVSGQVALTRTVLTFNNLNFTKIA